MTTGQSKTAAQRIASAEKREKALQLRKMGFSYEKIGEQIGCSKQHVHRVITEELGKLRESNYASAEDLRTLQAERIAYAINQVMIAINTGDITAVDKLCRLLDREARLFGLDAATRTEISGALTSSSEWVELRSVLLLTLGRFPDARQAVLEVISGKEVE